MVKKCESQILFQSGFEEIFDSLNNNYYLHCSNLELDQQGEYVDRVIDVMYFETFGDISK